MPDYQWKAAKSDGSIVNGAVQAPSKQQAISQLQAQGLVLLQIESIAASVDSAKFSIESSSSKNIFQSGKREITRADVLVLTTELSIMLQAGLSLDRSLRVLAEMNVAPAVAKIVSALLADVKDGMPLSKALGKHPAHFGDFYVNMVRSGEASGQLAEVLGRLVEHLERLQSLRQSVISALTYPAILLVVAMLSLVAMLGFVVPQFESLFEGMGDALPYPTKFIMSIGHAFSAYGVYIFLAVISLVSALRWWLRSPEGNKWLQAILLKLPLIGSLLAKYNLTLYARTLGTLLGNGVALPAALKIATETVQNSRIQGALVGILGMVKEGSKVAKAMQSSGTFDLLAVNLVKVGEETGRLGPMFLELAQILNRDVELGIKRALTLLEPLLILLLGLMIASIIVSILMGILAVNDLAV